MNKPLLSRMIFRLSLLIVLAWVSLTAATTPAAALDGPYDITSYYVDIKIDGNNNYHVTEHLTVDFHEARHGLIRALPCVKSVERVENGHVNYFVYHIKTPESSVNVDGAPFTTYQENGNLMIKIGDPGRLVTGEQEYTIHYDQFLGEDMIESQDMVYYNIIGTDWDCRIDHVTFSLTLPKAFDDDKVFFYSGINDTSSRADVDYQITGNGSTVTGSLTGSLEAGEGFTVQIDLPQDYFDTSNPFTVLDLMVGYMQSFIVILRSIAFT